MIRRGCLLTLKIIGTIVAIVNFLSTGEPTLAFPDITFPLGFFNNRHPPVKANDDHKADHPLDHNPEQEKPTKQNKPQAAVLAFYIGQLDMCATAFRTFLIQCHGNYLSIFIWV